MEEGDCSLHDESAWNEDFDISQLCRICANPNEYLIPIFQGEGKEHELEAKISEHLPIKISESDYLPTNLCYQCASTLIAWHDMMVGCLEADEKLKAASHYKTSNTTKITSETVTNDTQAENNRSFQQQNLPETRINNSVHALQEQDPKLVSPVEIKKVVDEENTSIVKQILEDKTTDSRFLSFRSFQIAINALKDKLINPKTKQLRQKRNTSASPDLKTLKSYKKTFKKACDSKDIDNVNYDEVYVKSKLQCYTCGREFTRNSNLKKHSLIHLNCNVFEAAGSDCIGIKCMESMNKTITTHTCEVCSRVFKAKDSYERHKRIHTNEKPFCCNECGKCFRDSGALTRHTKEVHAKIRNHPCSICNKWFVNRATLEDHLRTHTGERPFVCHQCGLMFKSRAALYQHGKTHTNYLPHGCVYCGKCFRRKQELNAHLPIHTNEKTHVCDKCGKAFCTRSELHRHIIVHSDEKPFTCLICSMNFSQKRYLKNHMKSRHSRAEDLQTQGLIPVEQF